ncbi:hypothetical protein CN080_17570 [Sinorhizobium meliloti]|nr:hypothetical protein CN080_17570 [Sinorhizobium meliloti]
MDEKFIIFQTVAETYCIFRGALAGERATHLATNADALRMDGHVFDPGRIEDYIKSFGAPSVVNSRVGRHPRA